MKQEWLLWGLTYRITTELLSRLKYNHHLKSDNYISMMVKGISFMSFKLLGKIGLATNMRFEKISRYKKRIKSSHSLLKTMSYLSIGFTITSVGTGTLFWTHLRSNISLTQMIINSILIGATNGVYIGFAALNKNRYATGFKYACLLQETLFYAIYVANLLCTVNKQHDQDSQLQSTRLSLNGIIFDSKLIDILSHFSRWHGVYHLFDYCRLLPYCKHVPSKYSLTCALTNLSLIGGLQLLHFVN